MTVVLQQLSHDMAGCAAGREATIRARCPECEFSACVECVGGGVQCHCLASSFGVALCDLEPGYDSKYTGPFKSQAQREMEAELCKTGAACIERCCGPGCGKVLAVGEAKLCTRCCSVVYCSVGCQKAAWSSGHKAACKAFLPAAQWPYISAALHEYREMWGRFPAPKLTDDQRAADAARAESRRPPRGAVATPRRGSVGDPRLRFDAVGDHRWHHAPLGQRGAHRGVGGAPCAAQS